MSQVVRQAAATQVRLAVVQQVEQRVVLRAVADQPLSHFTAF